MKTLLSLTKKFVALFLTIITLGIFSNAFSQTATKYTANNSFTVPSGVSSMTIVAWGGGGGGGGSQSNNKSGGGGGGGAIVVQTLSVTTGQTYTITIGNGGNGGANGANGSAGTATTVNQGATNIVSAAGGSGGAGTNSGGANANGGSGATASASGYGSGFFVSYGGGDGGAGSGSTGYGGSGGGSAGSSSSGSAGNSTGTGGSAGTGSYPGAAGANFAYNTGPSANGSAGTQPGSGGSGSYSNSSNKSGGNGGAGQVYIIYGSSITSISPNPICIGGTLTITGTNLSNAIGVTLNGIRVPIATNNSTSITVTIPLGTTAGPVSVIDGGLITAASNLTISTPSIVLATGTQNQTVCAGTAITTTTYTIGGGASGASVTNLPTGLSSSVSGSTVTIGGTPTAAGTYTITTTGGSCTQASINGTISLTALPTLVLATGTQSQTVCAASAITTTTYTIGGSATGTIVTNLPAGLSSSVSGSTVTISGTPTIAGTYTITTTGGSCTQVSINGTITLSSQPTLVLATGTQSQTVCAGTAITTTTYTIGGSATGANVTNLPAGLSSSVSGSTLTISGTPTAAGTYSITTTGGSCTQATLNGTITLNAQAPTPVITPSSATNCAGTIQTLQSTSTLSTSLAFTTLWQGTTNLNGVNSGAGANYITSNAATSYGVNGFNNGSNGMAASNWPSAISTNYGYYYQYTITAPANTTLTVNSLNLSNFYTSGNGNWSGTTWDAEIWYSLNGFNGSNTGTTGATVIGTTNPTTTPSFTPSTSNQSYSNNSFGTITLAAGQTLTIRIYAGHPSQSSYYFYLSGFSISGTVTSIPEPTIWTPVTGLYTNAAATTAYSTGSQVTTIYANPTSSTTYTVYGINTNNCQSAASTSVLVTVTAPPTLSLATGTQNQTICVGTAITNTTYTLGGGATGAIVTNLPAGLNSSVTGSVVTISGTPTAAGTYTITTTGGACTQTSINGSISLTSQPTLTLASGTQNQSVCSGTAINSTKFTIGGSATSALVTNLPAGLTSSVSGTTVTISGTPTASGTYTVTTTGGSCTQAFLSGTITVNPNITASVSISSNLGNTICAGTAVTFTATPTNGGASPSYQWKLNGNNISGATGSTYTSSSLANGNILSLVMTSNASPCLTGSPASSNSITMIVNAAPTLSGVSASAVCAGSAATINLSGLLPSVTQTVSYTIGSGSTQTVSVTSNGSGSGSFGTGALTSVNNGQTLTINSISTTTCTTNFGSGNTTTLVVNNAVIPSQPGGLSLGPVMINSITGSITAPAPVPTGYVIFYSTSSTNPTPAGGTIYTTGNTYAIGGSSYTAINTNSAGTFTINGLNSSTQYYIYVYSYNTNACGTTPTYSTLFQYGSIATASNTTDYFKSVASGNWSNASTWQSSSDGVNYVNASSAPTSLAHLITLQTPYVVTVASASSAGNMVINSGANLTIAAGNTLSLAHGTGTDLDVSGTVSNAGVLSEATGANVIFESGSTYFHNQDGGIIPTASWNLNSLVNVNGVTTHPPSGLGQPFGNFTWSSNQSSVVSLNSGLITINGNFIYITSSASAPLSLASGNALTLNIGGNFNIQGNSSSAAALRLTDAGSSPVINVSGSLNMTSGYLDFGAGSGSGTVNVQDNINLSGASYITTSTSNTFGNLNFSGTTQNLSSTTSGSISNLVFHVNSGSVTTMSTGMTMSSNSSFNVLTGGTLVAPGENALADDGSNSSTFTANPNSTLQLGSGSGITASGATGNIQTTTRNFNTSANYIYNGVVAQSTGSGLPSSISGSLTINNPAGVTLVKGLSLSGTLYLNAGILYTSSTNLLSILTSGSVSVAQGITTYTNTSYVSGPLSKTGNTAFIFPVGKENGYEPIGISAASDNNSYTFVAEYIRASALNVGTIDLTSPLKIVSTCDYYNLYLNGNPQSSLPNGVGINLTIYFNQNNPCARTSTPSVTNNYITDLTTLVIAHFNGSYWQPVGPGSPVTNASLAAPYTYNGSIYYAGVHSFSPFTLGSLSGLTNPLPLTLIDFQANINRDKTVDLSWTTEQEINTDYFAIQRSADGIHWTGLGEVKAKGNSPIPNNYSYTDIDPLSDVNYYRVMSVDMNGDYSYTVIRVVNILQVKQVEVFPNPANSFVNVTLSESKVDLSVKLINGLGQVLQAQQVKAGSGNTISFDVHNYAQGTYMIQVQGSDGSVQTNKVIIMR